MTEITKLFQVQVIQSEYCFQTVTVIRGMADKNRPNTKRPLYRHKVIERPTAYLVNGQKLVCHPALLEAVRLSVAIATKNEMQNMLRDLFESPFKMESNIDFLGPMKFDFPNIDYELKERFSYRNYGGPFIIPPGFLTSGGA